MTYQLVVGSKVRCVGPYDDVLNCQQNEFEGLGSIEYVTDGETPFRHGRDIDAAREEAEAKVKAAQAAAAGV